MTLTVKTIVIFVTYSPDCAKFICNLIEKHIQKMSEPSVDDTVTPEWPTRKYLIPVSQKLLRQYQEQVSYKSI